MTKNGEFSCSRGVHAVYKFTCLTTYLCQIYTNTIESVIVRQKKFQRASITFLALSLVSKISKNLYFRSINFQHGDWRHLKLSLPQFQ